MLYFIIFIYTWILGFILYSNFNLIRLLSYFYFLVYFLLSLFILLILNKSIIWYQIIFKFYTISFIDISYIIGIDGISISFILLCSFIILFCFLLYWYLNYLLNFYSFILFFSLWVLINIFASIDLVFFYIFFEGVVIPMFFLIGIWGSRKRKIYASYQFFIYTLLGSVFVLLVILSVYFNKGSSSFDFILNAYFFSNRHLLLLIFLFIGFGVKVPIMPLHIWLPEAHVEAPTPGSIILASILLKLGSYAILRIMLVLFFNVSLDFIFFILVLSLFSFTYASMVALSQIDIKKIIAYSSIAHMNFSLFGIFSESLLGLSGIFFLMFGHAITSGALFLSIGVLYDRYKTRLIFYYGSLVLFMPIFAICMFILILSNFGFPGTINFVGEFLILVGAFEYSNVIVFLSAFGMILTLIYSLSVYARIFFGSLQILFIRFYSECSRLEFFILSIFVFFVLFFGLFPNLIFIFNIGLYDLYSNIS
jgi:proton-translocating NADH-quinone oxidoreductase chain M